MNNKTKKELEKGKWSEKLKDMLMEEDIYFYEEVEDFIDKDLERDDPYYVAQLRVDYGNENDWFGFINCDGELYGFKTEKEIINFLLE